MSFRCPGLAVLFAITAIASEPGDARGWSALGDRQLHELRFEDARKSLLRAIELDAHFSDAYRILGEVEIQLQNSEAAYRAWIKADKLNPKDVQTKYYLGRIFYEADFFNEAAAWFREVLALSPRHFPAITYLALSAEALGLDDVASKLYQRAIEESKSQGKPYSWAFLGYSKLLRKQGDEKQARSLLEESERTCPEAHTLTALGQLLASDKQEQRAEIVLRRAIQMDPSVSDAHYRLSLLLKASGREDEANQEMGSFLRSKEIEKQKSKMAAIRK